MNLVMALTSDGITVFPYSNTAKFFKDRTLAAQYAKDRIASSRLDSPLTITIEPVKSGGYYVHSVIGTLSGDTPTPG